MGHSRKSANFPVPKTLKKMGRPRKNNTTSLNQKTAQEMEFTKHNKAIESIKEKKLRVYADKSRRHASEGAQALRKGDSTPSPLSPLTLLSIASSPLPSQSRYCVCKQCHIPKTLARRRDDKWLEYQDHVTTYIISDLITN